MWRSLRNQILIPIVGLLLLTTLGLGVWQALRAASDRQSQLESQIEQVVQTIAESNFPLTDRVCHQMKGLTGAEFIVWDAQGATLASSLSSLELARPESTAPDRIEPGMPIRFDHVVELASDEYFWTRVSLPAVGNPESGRELNVLYPTRVVREQLGKAIGPTLVVAAVAFLFAVGVAVVLAARVTSPLRTMREQTSRIAEGDFQPLALPTRKDEVYDLATALNAMSKRIADYEQTIRQTERLRTLGMLGGGLAHQLRNSATGARLAIDLHREECHSEAGQESLMVATRQLQLMERYLQKILNLGQPQTHRLEPLDLRSVMASVRPLLVPFAEHHQVDLQWSLPQAPLYVQGDSEALEDLLLNLVLNAIQAVTSPGARTSPTRVSCFAQSIGTDVEITILDNGPGVPADLIESIFDPFVTSKPDGVGLGLSVAKKICLDHGGRLVYQRSDNCTRFIIRLPLLDSKGGLNMLDQQPDSKQASE